MNAIQSFYDVTKQLVQMLEATTVNDRDERIEKINQLLNKREELLPLIKQPATEEDKQVAKEILLLNQKLMTLLEKEKLEIKKDINSLNHRKESTKKYVNPYESLQTDGMYYDKRK